ncbi:MAG TPA: hypothetical protein VF463_20910 [Sphingobium sp.]
MQTLAHIGDGFLIGGFADRQTLDADSRSLGNGIQSVTDFAHQPAKWHHHHGTCWLGHGCPTLYSSDPTDMPWRSPSEPSALTRKFDTGNRLIPFTPLGASESQPSTR